MIHKLYKWYLHNKTRIKIENFINRIISRIRNNKVANYIKELFLDYPLYMYSDAGGVYVSELSDGILEDGRPYSDISIATDVKYAKDFRKIPFKKHLLKKANEILAGNEQPFLVRYKSILTVESKMGGGEVTSEIGRGEGFAP